MPDFAALAEPVVVPEPGALILLLSGLLGAAALRFTRRRTRV
jgi:hypothetical protein